MGFYLLRRSLSSIGVVALVSVLTFGVLQWLPGDPAEIILGINASPTQLANLRQQLGLNQPWYEQYWHWVSQASQGNLGVSLVFGQPVAQLILQRLPVTLGLTALAFLIALGLGSPLGVMAAICKDSWFDKLARGAIFVTLGIPTFWVGLILIFMFAIYLHWLPVGGVPQTPDDGWLLFKSLIMPSLSLGLVEAAILARIVRRSMLEVLASPFMLTANSKGLPALRKYLRHGLRAALIGPLTVMGLQVSSLLGGAVVIENLFALPGIGRLLVVAVEQRDYPLLEGITIFFALVVVIISFMVDILYRRLDPRIRTK